MCSRWGVLCLFPSPSDKRVTACPNARNNTIDGEIDTTEIKGCNYRNTILCAEASRTQCLSAELKVSLRGELGDNAGRQKNLLVGM